MFGHSNYVCPENMRVVASQMIEIRSITSLFIIITCDQVIGLRALTQSRDKVTHSVTPLNIMDLWELLRLPN